MNKEIKYPIYYKYSVSYSDYCDSIVYGCAKPEQILELDYTARLCNEENPMTDFSIYWYTPKEEELNKLLKYMEQDGYIIVEESEFLNFFYENTKVVTQIK